MLLYGVLIYAMMKCGSESMCVSVRFCAFLCVSVGYGPKKSPIGTRLGRHEAWIMKTKISSMRRRMAKSFWLFAVVLVAALSSSCLGSNRILAAAGKPGDPPIYNPASKSYFQLLSKEKSQRGNRIVAYRTALTKEYKGVRGRLAVIDRPETHQFILQTFDLSREVWIGLRYWCRYRMLEWGGLRPYSPNDPGRFHAWHPQWYRNTQTVCAASRKDAIPYMPVYYKPLGERNARWQASGDAKFFNRFLVEYPTGEE